MNWSRFVSRNGRQLYFVKTCLVSASKLSCGFTVFSRAELSTWLSITKALFWPQHWEAWHHELTQSHAGERPDKSGRICKPFKPHLVWGLCVQPQSFIICGTKGLQHNGLFGLPWRSLIWTCCRVNIWPGGHWGGQMDSSHRPVPTWRPCTKQQILSNQHLRDKEHQSISSYIIDNNTW